MVSYFANVTAMTVEAILIWLAMQEQGTVLQIRFCSDLVCIWKAVKLVARHTLTVCLHVTSKVARCLLTVEMISALTVSNLLDAGLVGCKGSSPVGVSVSQSTGVPFCMNIQLCSEGC